MKWCKGEIKIKKDSMDTVLGVKKLEYLGIVGDRFHDQVTIRWDVDCGSVVAAVKIKTTVTTVLGLLAFYSERKPNLRSPNSALLCFTDFIGGFCLKKDGRKEENEEDEGMHSLVMRNTTARGFLWLLYKEKM